MKTKLFMIALAAAGFALQGCNDNDDDNIAVDTAIEAAFRAQYPGATHVEWERKSDYYVADFRLDNIEAEAWYDAQAAWHMTETDITFEMLPEAVKTSFAASIYADWRVDDVDKLERKGIETVYVIDVEQGREEYDLYYSPDGVLIKAIPDTNDDHAGDLPGTLPQTIADYLAANYPQAKVVDIDVEHYGIEVDIIDGTTPRELAFTTAGQWLYTKTDVRRVDVPQAVIDVLEASEYATWWVDEIDHYLTPDAEYYKFELESGEREVEITITTDGKLEVVGR